MSILLTAGLTLALAMPTSAAPESGAKATNVPTLTVTASNYHSVAKTSDGKVWYWGGIADVIEGKHTFRENRPELMRDLNDVADIQSSRNNEIVLKKDGTVWEWGSSYKLKSNENNDGTTEFPEPKQIKDLSNIVQISASGIASAIDKDGSVWVWHPEPYFTGPHKLMNVTDAKDISVNVTGKLAVLKKDGTVWEWSAFRDRNANDDYNASKINNLKDVVALSTGHGVSHFAIKKDGSVWGWGENRSGVMGLPISKETEVIEQPVQIESLTDVSSIVTGYYRTLVLKNDGSLWLMGYDVGNSYMDLKFGPELRRIKGLEKVTSVALGYDHAVAVTEDGKLWAWGSNLAGQLGDASFKNSRTPILVNAPR